MPKIQDQVSENRRSVQQIDGRFITTPDRRDQNLSFSRNLIEVTVGVAVYKRPLNDALISGHPNGDQHGSGHGVSGDRRGPWALAEDVSNTEEWVRTGRNAVRASLAGETGAVDSVAVGTSSASTSPTDTTLGNETGRTDAYGLRAGEANNAVRHRANFLFAETGEGGLDPVEYGAIDASGTLMGRVTTDAVAVAPNEEVRVDLTTTIEGSGNGSSVITDSGEASIADSLQTDAVNVGLEEIAWGTGTTAATAGDTSLETEVYRAVASREKSLETLTLSAPQFESQPSGQPYDYTEVGVFDNQGNLVWRTTLDPYEKDSNTRFTTSVGFKIN